MSESWVTVPDRHGLPKRHELRINGSQPTFHLQTDVIEAHFLEQLDGLSKDLLEIASGVFFADTSVRRGSDARPRYGERWSRDFDLRLAVRTPDLWSRPNVTKALVEALEFMTGDRFSFTFECKYEPEPTEPYFPFRGTSAPFQADEVILFSGGLDSLTGALDALKTRLGNVLLVTHRSAQKAIPRQENLAKILKRQFGGRVLHVQVRATRAGSTSRETTHRSRSFLFTALGVVTARMVGANRLSFYENGVVSHNLPISPQVVGTMASRTTHPQTLTKLQALISLLFEPPVAVENPYQWLTKTDVLTRLSNLDGSDLIGQTVSCTSLRNERGDVHHCGACSQCLDRRFAVLASGLEAHDRPGDYKVDVLTGPRESTRSRTMAMEWTRHACRLADMDVMQFAERFISDLARIAPAFRPDTSNQVIERCFDLQRRHGLAVRGAIEACTRQAAPALVRHQLDQTSLLGMFLRDSLGDLPDIADGLTEVPRGLGEADTLNVPEPVSADIFPLRVAFYEDGTDKVVEIRNLGCIRRGLARVPHTLRPVFEADRGAGLAPENYRYLTASEISADGVRVSPNTIVQNVRRCRAELADLFEAIEGHPPDQDLLIENARNKGYRMDPTIRIVRRDQVRGGADT